ncbi:hypothetical protein MKEN_00195700 [Mycena kentingensis (nom. inval.)]|nr:hypothetical protein MKEN_00195700 [Mycena kentingensis (nom. inval.)]
MLDPILPPELELLIFDLAAHQWIPSIPGLLLVAKRVREWVEPILYRTLDFTETDMEGLPSCSLRVIQEISSCERRAALLRHSAKNIIAPSMSGTDVQQLLRACPSVENLYLIWGNQLRGCLLLPQPERVTAGQSGITVEDTSALVSQAPASPPAPAYPPLRHIYCELDSLFDVLRTDFATHPAFTHLTHLELFGDPFEDVLGSELTLAEGYARILGIPRLTHLAVNDCPPFDICIQMLSPAPAAADGKQCSGASSKLEVFIVIMHGSNTPLPDVRALQEEPRFVMMEVKEYIRDWQRGRIGEDDYWMRAERWVARRRNGDLARDRFVVDS